MFWQIEEDFHFHFRFSYFQKPIIFPGQIMSPIFYVLFIFIFRFFSHKICLLKVAYFHIHSKTGNPESIFTSRLVQKQQISRKLAD